MLDSKEEKKYLFFLIYIFICLGFFYSYLTPFNRAPDEAAHLNYVAHLARDYRLPDPSLITGMADYQASVVGSFAEFKDLYGLPFFPFFEDWLILHENNQFLFFELHQPPLYYILAAPIFMLSQKLSYENSYLLIRLLSLLFGTATVYLVYKIGQMIFEKNVYLRLAMPTFVVAIPFFVYLSSVVNNDSLSIFLSTLLILMCLKLLKGLVLTKKVYFISGLIISFSLLAKVTIYPIILLFLIILLWKAKSQSIFVKNLILYTLIPIMIIAGPWFMRNYLIQGDFMGWGKLKSEFFPEQQKLDVVSINQWLRYLFESFWAKFINWSSGPGLGRDTYIFLKAISWLAIFGVVSFLAARWHTIDKFRKNIIQFFFIAIAINVLTIIAFNQAYCLFQNEFAEFFSFVPQMFLRYWACLRNNPDNHTNENYHF